MEVIKDQILLMWSERTDISRHHSGVPPDEPLNNKTVYRGIRGLPEKVSVQGLRLFLKPTLLRGGGDLRGGKQF